MTDQSESIFLEICVIILINSEHYVYSDYYLFQSFQETSFQVVLISGRNFSFILMNYGDIAVTGHPVQVK